MKKMNDETKIWLNRFKEAAVWAGGLVGSLIADLVLYKIWWDTDLYYVLPDMWVGDYCVFDVIAVLLIVGFGIDLIQILFGWLKENVYCMTRKELESVND